jgi:putative effector of murein hydrolase
MPIHWMLEVAVVCLAYPLYYQFNQLKSYLPILLFCSFMGITSATVLAFILCQIFNTPPELTRSLMALSVTTPITILTTQSLSGIGPIAAIMVILIGVFGALFGVYILNTINVKSPQAQGIALGVSCHAIGTAAALEQNPVCGAFASAAMTISAFITAIWVPILYTLLAAYS